VLGSDTTTMSRRPTPRFVGRCGSLRDTSRPRIGVDGALATDNEAGTRTALVDRRRYDLSPLHAADTDLPTAERLREAVERADGVLHGTSNYHGSYFSALATALDYCGRDEFEATTVGLPEVAAGAVSGSALIHLRTVSRTLGAWIFPTAVAVPHSHSVIDDTRITDNGPADRTPRLGEHLVAYAGVATYPETTAGPTEWTTGGIANDAS
jgi:NAD(P)H-dependent FMN reductase